MYNLSPADIVCGQYHDAWRSVRMLETEGANDERLHLAFPDLSDEDQAQCIVTSMIVEKTVTKRLATEDSLEVNFVRGAMEDIYDAYNRFRFAMRGMRARGFDWFLDRTELGPRGIALVPAYNTLSFNTKEIDRRMVIIGVAAVADQLPTHPTLERIQEDATAILTAVKTRTPYDFAAGHAIEASYN